MVDWMLLRGVRYGVLLWVMDLPVFGYDDGGFPFLLVQYQKLSVLQYPNTNSRYLKILF